MNDEALKELVAAAKQAQTALSANWFRGSDGEEFNNEDVIEADKRLSLALVPFAGDDWIPST